MVDSLIHIQIGSDGAAGVFRVAPSLGIFFEDKNFRTRIDGGKRRRSSRTTVTHNDNIRFIVPHRFTSFSSISFGSMPLRLELQL